MPEIQTSGRWFAKLPAWLNRDSFPLLTRIIAGKDECPTGSSTGHGAHAHNIKPDTKLALKFPGSANVYGCICFRLRREWKAVEESLTPTILWLHEYAHLVAGKCGHDRRWQQAFAEQLERFGYQAQYGKSPMGPPTALAGVAPASFWKYSRHPGGAVMLSEVYTE